MNKSLIVQTLVAGTVIVLLTITTSHNSMMSMNVMMSQTLPYAIVALVCILISLFVFEGKGDERDQHHNKVSDKAALFAVVGVLAVGIFIDQLHQVYNPWMVYSLSAAIGAKIISRWWSAWRN